MDPAGFAWRDVTPGVREKSLGRFTERQVDIGFVAVGPDAPYHIANSADAQHILFVTQGSGSYDAGEFEALTAFWLLPGEEIRFEATEHSELFSVVLPLIS